MVGLRSSQTSALILIGAELMLLENLELQLVVLLEVSMSGLALLPHLQGVALRDLKALDTITANEIGMLAFDFGQYKQHMK